MALRRADAERDFDRRAAHRLIIRRDHRQAGIEVTVQRAFPFADHADILRHFQAQFAQRPDRDQRSAARLVGQRRQSEPPDRVDAAAGLGDCRIQRIFPRPDRRAEDLLRAEFNSGAFQRRSECFQMQVGVFAARFVADVPDPAVAAPHQNFGQST